MLPDESLKTQIRVPASDYCQVTKFYKIVPSIFDCLTRELSNGSAEDLRPAKPLGIWVLYHVVPIFDGPLDCQRKILC